MSLTRRPRSRSLFITAFRIEHHAAQCHDLLTQEERDAARLLTEAFDEIARNERYG